MVLKSIIKDRVARRQFAMASTVLGGLALAVSNWVPALDFLQTFGVFGSITLGVIIGAMLLLTAAGLNEGSL